MAADALLGESAHRLGGGLHDVGQTLCDLHGDVGLLVTVSPPAAEAVITGDPMAHLVALSEWCNSGGCVPLSRE